jgi:ATP-dependent helicase HrpB
MQERTPAVVDPTDLPVEEAIQPLRAALAARPAAVLEAPPGAGKTTLVPLRLLDEPWLAGRRILMLEPRRLAARSAAGRMAELLREVLGETVGYAMRFERRVGPRTRIEVVTEGLLTRRLQRDPALEAYGLVIFDEFHERSLDADLGLALCLEVQESLRPDLRLLVMSATLDGAAVARLLGEAPVVRSEGRMFPVRTEHLAGDAGEPIELRAARAIQQALAASPGSILVFLPGAGEIRRTEALLRARLRDPRIEVHPLHGDLPRAAQDAAIRPPPPGRRKVVLATNIAETSLTIEGVSVVVDAGLERRARFSPRTGMSRLVTVPISRASAEQRKGRAGRLGPGSCYRLWPAEEDRGRREHRPAEIEEADLAPLALELAAWGVREPSGLRLPTQPPAGPFGQARQLLRELEALDEAGAVTPHGRAMAELPLHPRLAHMVLHARARGMAGTALVVAALLGGRDPDRSDADLARRVELLARDGDATHEARRIRRQLARALGGEPGEARAEEVGTVTALAYPDRLAQARGSTGSFRLANGRGARLDPHDPLAKEPWLAVAELDDAGAEARIRLAAPLSLATVEELFGERFVTEEEVRFDPREAAVAARRVTRLGSLVIKEQMLADADPERVAAVLCRGIRARGLAVLPWGDAARQLRARVAFLHGREPDAWPDLSDEALLAGLEDWLGPYLAGCRRLSDLAGLDLHAILRARLDRAQLQALNRRAPAHLKVPSGREIAIDYEPDPPALAVKLQELFGLAATPAVDESRVPLSLQLLSPAQRPVAVTRDLASFWATGYPAVRKELRGRYPKHPWPDDPLTAPATHRAKPRA